MNVKTSYFNKKIYTQNIKKALPLLAALLIFELLLSFGIINSQFNVLRNYDMTLNEVQIANHIKSSILNIGNQFIMIVYSFCCALSLFYYMFNGKLCKTIHSLPVTRLCMFITNIVSGITLIIIPFLINTLLSGAYIAIKGGSFFTILFTMGIEIPYCFIFFSIAVLAIMLTGHIIATPIMYGFLNFGFFITENMCMLIVRTFFYGLSNANSGFGHTIFTPVIYLSRYLALNYETGKFYTKGFYMLAIYSAAAIVLLRLTNTFSISP